MFFCEQLSFQFNAYFLYLWCIVYMKQSPLNFKIILLGDPNIGKTSFIRQFIDNQYTQTSKPTISVDFVSKTYQIDQFSVKLNIFDTAGQERYRSLTKNYLKGTDAVLFMYSMQSKESFRNVLSWIQYYENQSENNNELRVLVGTKKDLLQSSNKVNQNLSQRIQKGDIKELVESNNFTFKFQTSAKENVNISLVFEQLSRNLIYNSIKKKKTDNSIMQSQWHLILARDKEHLLKEEEKNQSCC